MRDSKKEKLMHSVSVCPCQSETMCAHTFCMWLHCFDMLSCPDFRMTTASTSKLGRQSHMFFNTKYLLYNTGYYSYYSLLILHLLQLLSLSDAAEALM